MGFGFSSARLRAGSRVGRNKPSAASAMPLAWPMASSVVAIARRTTITWLQSETLPQPLWPSAIHGPATGIRRSFAPTVSGHRYDEPRAKPYQPAVVAAPAISKLVRADGGGYWSTLTLGSASRGSA